jgi:hypothetical protein
MNEIERRVRAMTKAERRAYLLAAGCTRCGSCWWHPSREPQGTGGDRGFYSLAAAIRTALAEAEP